MEITRGELQYLLDLQMQKYMEQLKPTIASCVGDALNNLGVRSPKWISQAEAYRVYGRTAVRRWVMQGWLPMYSDGNGKRKRILKADLERCVARNNRAKNG